MKLPGTPSDETIGVAVHDGAEEIARVQTGEKAAAPVEFPADDFD